MSGPNPQVSVFHFTSRISSAKIKKYKLATERGMAGGNYRASTAGSSNVKTTRSPSIQAESSEPPAKKAKLRLSNPQSESPETIAVSRPHRESSLRIRYSENMVVDEGDLEDESTKSKPKPSPAASSDLSSLTSTRSIGKEPTPPKAPSPKMSKRADYSRDFMSYYVDGVDDDEDELSQPVPEPVAKKPAVPTQAAPAGPAPTSVQAPPQKDARFRHHVQPNHAPPKMQPPNRLPPPQPTVQLIDNIKKNSESKTPDTVVRMIKKLEALSTALTNFGGVPAVPKSPSLEKVNPSKSQPAGDAAGEKKDVDDFLAMFDDDDSNDTVSEDDAIDDDDANALNYRLETPGQPDSALTYGIQFIQNALKSWAQQRLSQQYAQHYMQQEQERLRNDAQPQKRGPGRPRKFNGVDDELPRSAPLPSTIQMDLAKTPEGLAIAAFQEVLDSQSLQVNAVFPSALTRALRHLYMQIDHLINQGSRNEPPWQCMSYGAQISAQKIRVDKWKEAQAKAQEEMARQHHIANQQMMEQMGVPQRHRIGPLTAEQAQREHAIELERRRSMQHAAQQPHLTQYLTNPMSLNSAQHQRMQAASAGLTPAPTKSSPANHVSASSPGAAASKLAPAPTNVPNGATSQSSPPATNNAVLDRIKMYMPNYLPRSGQQMKFSFAPHSELALKAFGAQAFPPNSIGPNLPNRGPMSLHTTNGAAASPTLAPKEASTHMPHASSSSVSDNIDVKMKDASIVTTSGATSPTNKTSKGPSPKVLNTYHELDPPASSAAANTEAKPSIEIPNGVLKSHSTSHTPAAGEGKDLASKFPHPGAVIIDQ